MKKFFEEVLSDYETKIGAFFGSFLIITSFFTISGLLFWIISVVVLELGWVTLLLIVPFVGAGIMTHFFYKPENYRELSWELFEYNEVPDEMA